MYTFCVPPCVHVHVCIYVHVPFLFCSVANAQIPADMFQFVRRLVTTFGISLEQTGGGIGGTGGGGGGGALSHETLAKRAQAAAQDPAFQRLKAQFAADFDFRYIHVHVYTFVYVFSGLSTGKKWHCNPYFLRTIMVPTTHHYGPYRLPQYPWC